jgi:hypothetical protein
MQPTLRVAKAVLMLVCVCILAQINVCCMHLTNQLLVLHFDAANLKSSKSCAHACVCVCVHLSTSQCVLHAQSAACAVLRCTANLTSSKAVLVLVCVHLSISEHRRSSIPRGKPNLKTLSK